MQRNLESKFVAQRTKPLELRGGQVGVVYFDQLLGARRTQKLVKIHNSWGRLTYKKNSKIQVFVWQQTDLVKGKMQI